MEYQDIKIFLHTNLASLSEENRTILFESSMLQHPTIQSKDRKTFKKYPIVSTNTLQNFAALSELTFLQKAQFFFDLNSHLPLLTIYPNLYDRQQKQYNGKDPKEYFKQYNSVIKKNIECMLTLLFVSSPLNSVTVTSSWDLVIDKFQMPKLPTPYGFLRNISDISQIMIGGKPYSFDRLIWMNDILNCPVYKDLFINYRKFLRWRENEKRKIRTVKRDESDVKTMKDKVDTDLKEMQNLVNQIYKAMYEDVRCAPYKVKDN